MEIPSAEINTRVKLVLGKYSGETINEYFKNYRTWLDDLQQDAAEKLYKNRKIFATLNPLEYMEIPKFLYRGMRLKNGEGVSLPKANQNIFYSNKVKKFSSWTSEGKVAKNFCNIQSYEKNGQKGLILVVEVPEVRNNIDFVIWPWISEEYFESVTNVFLKQFYSREIEYSAVTYPGFVLEKEWLIYTKSTFPVKTWNYCED
jgi:hypothetical protein